MAEKMRTEDKKYFSYEWVIKKFGTLTGILDSPDFYISNKNGPWKLQVFPNGDDEVAIANGYISFYLIPKFHASTNLKTKIYLMDTESNEITNKEFVHTFSGEGYGYSKFIKRDEIFNTNNGTRLKDTFIIFCKFLVVKDKELKEHSLTSHFQKVFGVSDFSDILLSVGDKEFRLHKVILAARSPVFAAMFKHPMEEANTSTVTISDISAEVMEQVIRYIYTDETPKLKEMAEDILPAANKYDLKVLKELCADELLFQLSVSNAVHTLELADMFDLLELKSEAITVIGKHFKKIVACSEWKVLTNSKTEFVINILTEFIINNISISSS